MSSNLEKKASEIFDWWELKEDITDQEKKEILQQLIIIALKETQDEARRLCAEAVGNCEDAGSKTRIRRYEAIGACLTEGNDDE